MVEPSTWTRTIAADPEHSHRYAARWRRLAAEGHDLDGEARMLDAMTGRGSRILDAGCGTGRVGGHLATRGHTVVGVDVDPALIDYAEADFTALNDGHPARLATFLDYLSRNGLDNIFAHDGASEAFDLRMSATAFPPAVGIEAPSWAGSLGARARRRRYLAREALRANGRQLRSAILRR